MSGRKRILTPHQEAEIVLWWLSTRSVKAKARELGVSPSTIHAVVCRNGVHTAARTSVQRRIRELLTRIQGAKNERTTQV